MGERKVRSVYAPLILSYNISIPISIQLWLFIISRHLYLFSLINMCNKLEFWAKLLQIMTHRIWLIGWYTWYGRSLYDIVGGWINNVVIMLKLPVSEYSRLQRMHLNNNVIFGFPRRFPPRKKGRVFKYEGNYGVKHVYNLESFHKKKTRYLFSGTKCYQLLHF